MERKEYISVIIPALNPTDNLINLTENLINSGIKSIIVVDDGSDKNSRRIFNTIEELPEVHLLTHVVNQGKGRSLKTAFNHILANFPECTGVVTTDCNGQHNLRDIHKCIDALISHPDSLVIGCRDLTDKAIPTTSRFGN